MIPSPIVFEKKLPPVFEKKLPTGLLLIDIVVELLRFD